MSPRQGETSQLRGMKLWCGRSCEHGGVAFCLSLPLKGSIYSKDAQLLIKPMVVDRSYNDKDPCVDGHSSISYEVSVAL